LRRKRSEVSLVPLRREVIVPQRAIDRARLAAFIAAALVIAAGAVDAMLGF
jgi:hypothetical protein